MNKCMRKKWYHMIFLDVCFIVYRCLFLIDPTYQFLSLSKNIFFSLVVIVRPSFLPASVLSVVVFYIGNHVLSHEKIPRLFSVKVLPLVQLFLFQNFQIQHAVSMPFRVFICLIMYLRISLWRFASKRMDVWLQSSKAGADWSLGKKRLWVCVFSLTGKRLFSLTFSIQGSLYTFFVPIFFRDGPSILVYYYSPRKSSPQIDILTSGFEL